MLLQYDWPVLEGDVPEVGTWLDLSGDPDRPVLRGAVARTLESEDPEIVATLSIIVPDGQAGAEEFQHWLVTEGSLGVARAHDQNQQLRL